MNDKTIIASLVDDEVRMNFLPACFGRRLMMKGEASVYSWMDKLCEDYNGGYWHFYTLSNGGFYMAPEVNEPMRLQVVGNYFDGELSSDAAGIVTTLFAIQTIASRAKGADKDRLIDRYYLLQNFASEHPESAAIFRAID
ncbi:antirestriction protein [uncultured Microbulbifer sp.]|uniref:antirestriction protein n=1 Tax=uncultured Microbulbifer sp. TaxID=348147 RepID=UPI0026380358|nr:antirestriction protein [uncultured Microbulbifer sp.]